MSRRALLRGGAAGGVALVAAPAFSRLAGATANDGPRIVTRRKWGADEARRGVATYDAVAEKIVVHHTGTSNAVTDWAAQVREIYEYETGNGYRDLAYHYLVDPDGAVYEGRWARPFRDGEQPDAQDAFARLVRGGHALRHNPRTIGVALLGDYTQAAPSRAAIAALEALLVWHCTRWRIDAAGSSWYRSSDGAAEMLPNIVGHGAVRVTECPGAQVRRLLDDLRARVAARVSAPAPRPGGYRLVARDGRDAACGDLSRLNTSPLPVPVSGVAGHPNAGGYWAYAADGGVFAVGSAPFYGSLGGARLNAPVVGLAPTPSGGGYWLAAADGGVFAFGDAPFLGSLAGTTLNAPLAGICATASGTGYWLFSSDGGVFAFGDARYHGSLASAALNAPVTAMARARNGYWLAGADGGVFAFGDAEFHGTAPGDATVVAIAPTPSQHGYLLVSADGLVHPFGDAAFHGNATGTLTDAVGFAGVVGGSG